MYIILAEERRALYAEDFKNLKSYIGCITLKRRRETQLKAEKKNKRFILKMLTSVIIVVAGLFQKQMETEDEKRTNEDDYIF